jgi:hypothetical protein
MGTPERRFPPTLKTNITDHHDITDRHDITEILLKVALNTIKQTKQTNKQTKCVK